MTRKNIILIIRLAIALIVWLSAILIQHLISYSFEIELVYLSLYIVAYIISGYDILWGALKHIISGNFLDEYFLMSIATIGAFCIRFFGDIEYLEGVAVMIFFQIGEVFQGYAVERSRKAIMNTLDLSITKVTLESGEVIDPEDVKIDDVIIVKPGEMIPLDGVLVTNAVINSASLTGEALDLDLSIGDEVLSGSINTTMPIKVRVTKEYYDSTATKIIDMVENATMKKAKSERFISRFASIYTPIVVGLAIILGGLIPLIICFVSGFDNASSIFSPYVYAALVCLVVSCPCALVVSVPLTFFAGIGASAKKKIIIKGGISLEEMSKCDTVVLDKTGTLTKSAFEVVKVIGDDEVLKIAKGLEINSTHPLAQAVCKLDVDYYDFEIEETPGYGVVGIKDNVKYLCGSKRLMDRNNVKCIDINEAGSILYIAKDNECLGAIILEDVIKDEAQESISILLEMGIRVVVLSGDTKLSVESICNRLGITEYHYALLPNDKVRIVEEIINSKDTNKVIFVGDGINDAPVLALSDIGVSMGQIGSDAAIEASDVVVLNDNLNALPNMLSIAKRTKVIVIENIIFTIGVKVIILLLSAIGNIDIFSGFKLPMWVAIFGDVGVCLIAILNSMRALKTKKIKNE